MLPNKPFWMVYGIGQGAPNVMHDTPLQARDEAKRLARNNPGVVFIILEAIGGCVKREFDTVSFRSPERVAAPSRDDIPS